MIIFVVNMKLVFIRVIVGRFCCRLLFYKWDIIFGMISLIKGIDLMVIMIMVMERVIKLRFR